MAPVDGREQRDNSGGHEAKAHNRNDLHRKGTPCDDGRSIEEQPHARNGLEQAGAIQDKREERADDDRR